MKLPHLLLLLAFLPLQLASADEIDARTVFGTTASQSVSAALKRAAKENKRVLVFVHDPKKTQAWHIKAMVENAETKTLLKDHFLIVITDFKDKAVTAVLPANDGERPMYVLFGKDGKVIQTDTAAMGANNGNKLVKEWAATP